MYFVVMFNDMHVHILQTVDILLTCVKQLPG